MYDRFAYPWVLGLIAVVPVLLLVAWLRSGRGRLYYPTAGLGLASAATLRSRLTRLPLVLRAAALVLLLVAAARPQDALGLVRTSTEGVALQIVLDRSSSMAEPITLDGAETTRLAAVKKVAAEFVAGNDDDLKGRPGDMIGVIAFASYADTICPLVRERGALLDLIGKIDFVPRHEGGTAIGEAVALAAARLREAEEEVSRGLGDEEVDPEFTIKSKAVILLTDGQNNRGQIAPMEAAELCREWGITLYTIGISGESSVDFGGMRMLRTTPIDSRTLRAMASHTGGRFWLADSAEALREVYAEIDSLEKTEIETSESVEYKERFTPFAAAALALLALEQLLAGTWLRRVP